MVVIHIKKGDSDGFLCEISCDQDNNEIVRTIVTIHNLRIILNQLVGCLRQLAKYGPMKSPDKQSLDEIDEKYNGVIINKNEYYAADPSGIRTGNGIGPQLTEMVEKVCIDTENILDKNNVLKKIIITKEILIEKLNNIRGVIIICYPMGLPEYDTIRIIIDNNSQFNYNNNNLLTNTNDNNNNNNNNVVSGAGLEGSAAGVELLDADTAELWIASRCLDRRQKFRERFGDNNKAKMIARLQRLGQGAPGREAAVSEDERKAMMAYYFKKQEEYKAISENNEDDYLNSVWANNKQLQNSLRGNMNVKAPGIR